jgi:hypothetical protein
MEDPSKKRPMKLKFRLSPRTLKPLRFSCPPVGCISSLSIDNSLPLISGCFFCRVLHFTVEKDSSQAVGIFRTSVPFRPSRSVQITSSSIWRYSQLSGLGQLGIGR